MNIYWIAAYKTVYLYTLPTFTQALITYDVYNSENE